jgi:DNA-binding HxlR family transcriptional regulator
MTENCTDTLPPKPGVENDIFELCPVARAFEVTGSKWRLTVLRCLHLWGEQRFSELQETSTADSKTLSRVLGDLEEQNLVRRRLEDRPIATYYHLTDRGRALADVLEAFEEWAFEWGDAELPPVRQSE